MPNTGERHIFPLRSLVPNAITVLAICAGMSAMRFAILGQWEGAVFAVLIAGVLDGLDGRMARLLKGSSKFGAELDSLSDIVSFGVAPAVIMYSWTLRDVKGIGWLLALIFTTSMALRLARFNTMNQAIDVDEEERRDFFSGIPAPASAALALWPMILYFLTGYEFFKNPVFCVIYLGVIAALTISSVPTFSFKKLSIKREFVLFYLLGISVFATLLVTQLWATMSIVGLVYVITIPMAILSYRRRFGNGKAPKLSAETKDGKDGK
ncbi:CDP-diacylglycerol--serine O-phosphatidyltransferase [hydrothermal vent metagenome]|uniref:CDP-diacylglycerol--serine O-phosphatidyltransferase n=1 Tax=hydrothermal vent metagenome TaxID=652676 RepID=A0A3B0SUF8_9ZZZZ